MGSSDTSANSSAPQVALYGDTYYVSEYWWSGVTTVARIETLAQPVDNAAVYMGELLDSLDASWRPEVDLSLGSCTNNSSQAMASSGGDCAHACFNTDTLYLPYNLQACLSLGVLSMLIQNGSLELDSENSTNNTIESYNIGNLSAWDGTSIVQNITNCAVSACTQNNVADCPTSMTPLDGLTVTAANLETVYTGLENFCNHVGTKVNSDIAGPGVMFSYLIQICVAFLLWFLARVLTSWTRVVVWPFLLCSSRRPPSIDPLLSQESQHRVPGRIKSAWLRATEIQAKLSKLRLHAATSTTLVEFQEVQAFFVGAIQIATLATFKPTPSAQADSANTVTFGEAINDSRLVETLGINGTLPILLIQCVLQRYGMRWWYTFTLVMATFILALVVQARSSYFVADFDTLWSVFEQAKPVEACGGLPNPQVYCDTYTTLYASAAGIYGMYFTVPVLILDFMAPSVLALSSVRAALDNWWRTSRVFRFLSAKVWRPFLKSFWFFVELVILYFTVLYLGDMMGLLSDMTYNGSLGTWSFGQLIAVMVWVPPLFKFVYFNIFGIEEGFGRRLAHDYRVVHEEQPAEQSSDTALDFVALDELQQDHEAPKDSPYESSDAGNITPSMRMGSYSHLIQSPPEPYSPDFKSSWSRRWPRS